ncbi:hypothetical protein GMD78_09095 [Ornithinibacillus sp. L9]|uniref:Uncharacterized protein n=1 Tax=Ornithinibacillus caprae TaxID=2678566 RepID=A0A6N8FJQ4_9BACI|nr:hypothetical protein [Ornithinibacillus caprae]MUK88544.1 hypothetical protein [Ornithinibacillus caprae]
MNKSYSSILILLFSVVVYLITTPQTIFAHKMIIDHAEDGLIFVHYDNGSPAKMAEVTLYDKNGNALIEKKQVDENGYLEYDKQLQVHRMIADDGLGHRAASLRNEAQEETIPKLIKVLLGLSILSFIASIFYFRTKRK